MNAVTCTCCGDVHLCPGGHTIPASDQLLTHIAGFIEATFHRDAHGIVGSQEAYDAYRTWCGITGTPPYSVRRFVAAMAAQPGVRRIKRSTMRFAGLRWAHQTYQARHLATDTVPA